MEYYNNNITGTLDTCGCDAPAWMQNIFFFLCNRIHPAQIPDHKSARRTVYQLLTKSMLEQILTDMQKADPEWNVILLRYQPDRSASVRTGWEKTRMVSPNNLMPYITQVAVGKLKRAWGIF